MSNIFISPCGTSLLTNNVENNIRQLLFKNANCQEDELNAEDKAIISQHIQQRHEMVLGLNDFSEVKKLSAELNGILTYYQNQIPNTGMPDIHYILVSDTYQGQQVGKIIVAWLNQQNLQAQVVNITDLATNEKDRFRIAMSELISWCEDNIKPLREAQYHVIFNLTGGFKSVQGFLQAISSFYADETIYIFQFSSELLQIPRLPIKLDTQGIIDDNLTIFRRLGLNYPVNKDECKNIPETLLFILETEENVQLSEWGNLIWLQAKDSYYKKELLPPLSNKLLYSDQFKNNIKDLPKNRLREINIRCDQLSRYLDSNKQDHLQSLDFKKLKDKLYKGSTHECDAWADGKAKRIFGHFIDDGKYIIDCLDYALH